MLIRTLNPSAYAHSDNVRSNVLKIELVGADVGDAKYSAFGDPMGTRVASGTPAVVFDYKGPRWYRFCVSRKRVPLMFGLS